MKNRDDPQMNQRDPKTTHIVISDREPGLPFSKGLMASQVMVTGLSPYRAYQVAEAIEDRLRDQGLGSITSDELSEVALSVINEIAGSSPVAQLALAPLGRLLGEPNFGPVTRVLLSAFEGGAFGFALAWGLTARPRL